MAECKLASPIKTIVDVFTFRYDSTVLGCGMFYTEGVFA